MIEFNRQSMNMEVPTTIYQKFEEAVLKHPKNIALGWKINERYQTASYKQLLVEVNRCATGLKKLEINAGDKVAIFSKNRPEWIKLDLALNKIGAISVPIHSTLSPRLIKFIINNSGVTVLAIGELFSKFQEIEDQVALKKIITFNEIVWRGDLIYFGDLLKEEPDKTEPIIAEACTIIYTSGTTGEPKGAVLTNKNFLSNIEASLRYVPYTSKDVFLSFMPLSHVLERTGGYYAPLFCGAGIYFAGGYQTVAADIKQVKPTAVVSVPRLFEKMYDKIMDKVRLESRLKQRLIYYSLKLSRFHLNSVKNESVLKPITKIIHYFTDRFVLSKIRAALGGRLRFAISGGASLNPSIAKFFEAVGINILEGYGLTETSPIIAVNPITCYRFGTVGKVIPGVEVKIAADKEILVAGSNVMKCYYNNEAANKQAFEVDGPPNEAENEARWFKTGDLGHLDKDGYLTIIGRKKEMIVTSTGKNVNPADLENALQESKYIRQAMVFGDKKSFISALIVADFGELKIYAKENNINLEPFELIKYQPVIDLIGAEIYNRLKDFPDNEQVKKFHLLEKEFSEEREELTPTLKLRRDKILENYREIIEAD